MENQGYPARATAQTDEVLSRILIFFKWFLAIPHYVVLGALYCVAYLFVIISWFAILFTGQYPRGLFNFVVGVLRWDWRLNMYLLLVTDRYPPFSLDNVEGFPAQLDVDYADHHSRLLIFFKFFLAFPHFIALCLLQMIAGLFVIISWFAILFTGRYPQALATFNIGTLRWKIRIAAYLLLLTDKYPPFSLEE